MSDPQTFFLPEGVSTFSGDVDSIYYFVYWVSVFFFALIVTTMIVFVVRYRRRSETETTPHFSHNTALEITWSVAPLFLIFLMFLWGFQVYMKMRVPPRDAMEVQVTAERWKWTFTYPDGTVVPSDLGVPVNKPVKLIMSSKDVIHSFYVPNFRIKQDVLPNRYTSLWFQATKTGDYHLFCAEFCGAGHSGMLGTVKVMEPDAYETWLSTGGIGDLSKLSLVDQGKVFYKKFGCVTCHNLDSTTKVGPGWGGIFGHQTKLADGRSVTVDENYIRKSIMEPNADIVAGFPNSMPTFKGTIKDEQVNALIALIKSLNDENEAAPND